MLTRTLAALFAVTALLAPAANATPPTPGQGDDFFYYYVTDVMESGSTFSQVQAVIPLAKQVCEAKAEGKTDLEAANVFYTGNGIDTLGIVTGSVAGDQSAALEVAQGAILAYCSKYNTTNW
jgi:hypothetical protein